MWEDVGGLVSVPSVVGMPFPHASAAAHARGVTLANPDPDGPPISALAWEGSFIIASQHPAPGALVTRHSSRAVEIVVPGEGTAGVGTVLPHPDDAPAGSGHAEPTGITAVNLDG